MAGKTSAKKKGQEAVPVAEKTPAVETVNGPDREEAPAVETVNGSEGQEHPVKESEKAAGEKMFRITCRNNVSETIGGVKFVNGVGYTRNAYSASWFANKDGYEVDLGE